MLLELSIPARLGGSSTKDSCLPSNCDGPVTLRGTCESWDFLSFLNFMLPSPLQEGCLSLEDVATLLDAFRVSQLLL